MLPEMGYPSHWDRKGEIFTRGLISHYVVLVGHHRAANKKSGYLESFAAGSRVRVARARAETVYPGEADVYRRTFAMVDSGDESFLIDHFHVRGGDRHDYQFHGIPFGRFEPQGLDLVSTQTDGTLLGKDVAWASDSQERSTGYDLLRNVRRFRPTGEVWRATWVDDTECRLDYWMPAFPEVIVCDGEPPAKPGYPETMEFVVVRNPASESRFPAVIAPCKGQAVVQSAAMRQDGDVTHYDVETEAGTWAISVSDDGAFEAHCKRLDGASYAFATNRDALVVGSKRIGVRGSRSYTIASADYATGTIRTHEKIRDPELLIGEVAVIGGHGHSASYTVVEAKRRMIRFEAPAITGLCVAASEGKPSNVVRTESRVSGYGCQLAARGLAGMVLVPEGYGDAWPILSHSTEDKTHVFTVSREAAVRDADNDGRAVCYFADFAPGYTVRFTPWIEAELDAEGRPRVRANIPVAVR